MVLHQSPLVKTLGTNESFQVDMGLLILSVHKLMILSSPLTKILVLLEKLRRWESSGVSMFMLIASNSVCTILPPGYIMTFVFGGMMLVGGLGVAHRRTGCLIKVFPPVTFTQEDLYSLDGPLSHAEMVIYYKAMLFKVEQVVQQCNSMLTYLYSVLKWEDLHISIRWYMSVFIMVCFLHVLPLRWSVVMAINLFLLEGKIANAITEKMNQMKMKVVPEKPAPIELPKCGNLTDDWVSYGSQDSFSTTELTQCSDTESELSEKAELSSSEMSECEEALMQENETSTAVVNRHRSKSRSGVVNKIIEFKKKHQHSHSGSCFKCRTGFSAILKRRHLCINCGNNFCSRCCSQKIPRAFFGATSPAAQTETVPVCGRCYMVLHKDKVS